MRTIPFAPDLVSTRMIYGCMRIAGTWNPAEIDAQHRREAFAAIEAALEAGYNHFDHADIYARGGCEQLFGDYLKDNPGVRERILITTKCGIRWSGDSAADAPHRYDFSAAWIEQSCEGSLKRLGVDTLDLYLLHRPDALMDPDEVAGVFDKLHTAGKVRYFGVSNFSASQTALLASRLSQPLVCNQIEVHPLRLAPFEDGTLDALYAAKIVPTSWSPLAGGRLGDGAAQSSGTPGDDARLRLVELLDTEAKALGVSRAALICAWLLKHPANILPIIGSRKPQRIRDAVQADGVELSREAWYRIYVAARGQPLP